MTTPRISVPELIPGVALTAETVPLLEKGDWLFDQIEKVALQFEQTDGGTLRTSRYGVSAETPSMTFLGRPGPGGFILWSGGENPLPGGRVDYNMRGAGWQANAASDALRWSNQDWATDITGWRPSSPPVEGETDAGPSAAFWDNVEKGGAVTEAMISAAVESCVRNTGKSRAWVKEWMPGALRAALTTREEAPAEAGEAEHATVPGREHIDTHAYRLFPRDDLTSRNSRSSFRLGYRQCEDDAQPAPASSDAGEALARRFHETYERLAPSFGYETRPDTKDFDPSTPNGRLMIAVCSELAALTTPAKVEAVPVACVIAFREGQREPEFISWNKLPVGEHALYATPSTASDKLRALGWSVAVHNDYRLSGEQHTFWLWTHPDGRWIKGEGRTDAEANDQALSALTASEGK